MPIQSEFEGKRFRPVGPFITATHMFYIHDTVAETHVCGMNSMTPLVYACRAMNDWIEIATGGKRLEYIERLQSYLIEDHKKSQPKDGK
jgi:hypothetical protein